MNKKLLISLIIVITFVILGYNYLYQDHRDVSTSKVSATFTSSELIILFTDNDIANDIKALDQVIEVKGVITNIEDNMITLDNQIFIEMSKMSKSIQKKSNINVTIKGRCLGYDDLLEEVKIDQATLQ